ncbi:MAG: hypothetical protein HY360_03170 [Verrucomicrobia bacterium]|nr:hypothetical protein [Verrucomicrobiota bacterium]
MSRTLASKEDVAKLEAKLVAMIADTKVELLRWMFLFWVGQIAIVAGLIRFMR